MKYWKKIRLTTLPIACIIDWKMPDMDRNYCKQIPIVAMTANAFAEDVLAAKTVGMNEHIAKPFEIKTLAKTLKKWI